MNIINKLNIISRSFGGETVNEHIQDIEAGKSIKEIELEEMDRFIKQIKKMKKNKHINTWDKEKIL